MEPEQPQASVLRFVIYLAIQFPPKFSSLCSPCFQSVSREITIHIDLLCLQFLSLQDLFSYWMGSELSHLSLAYNGSSLEGFVTMSSYGTATTLICFFSFQSAFGSREFASCCLYTEAVGTSNSLRPQTTGHSFRLNFSTLAVRTSLKHSLFSFYLWLQTGQFLSECLFPLCC